ncbi:hypothetical protein N018_08085 [Pseudomonas syringae CC1557]|uniref:EamA domain-containing protein n=1 Tax=Pseudomonas syringae CC1557 TaxID=1357279 RepID=W0N234_PSESX|nr:hypothetical protein N018_08085 [Pseudomonas syringae CC1557]
MGRGAVVQQFVQAKLFEAQQTARLEVIGAAHGKDFIGSGKNQRDLWGLIIAVLSSVIGAWAWNSATRRLPMVLSGQLISLEGLFAAALGFLFEGRLPTPTEASGLIALLTGAGIAVHRILSATGESANA